ncbi:MAG: hypothetical protein WA829_07300 [Candidatus Acidiferrum sp.]|jgi:hypothetical protein
MPISWSAILVALVPVGVQFVLFLRWLHRRMRNDEIVRAFVRDIATNHLPHIYAALHAIARKQGIDAPEPPMVRFVEINGRRHRD